MELIMLEDIEMNAKLFNKFALTFEEFGKTLIRYGKNIKIQYNEKANSNR